MSDFQSGRVLADRYKLVSVLGQGGMGSVWRAEHLMLGSEVAVKLIDPEIAKNPEARARFVREARSAAALRSPHVVQILDYGVDGEVPFIVMELMVGESLADRLERVGRIGPEETARIMTDVARALAKAHEAGIIHRDLKPDNIFLVENDDVEVAKVLDFGVARVTSYSSDNAGMTSTGAVLGTPYYMSPEQAEGLKDLDHRTDIWAMAVMTYECIVGVRPFTGDTLGGVFLAICAREIPVPSIVATVPQGFDVWFKKGTSRNLAERFRTVREAAKELREVCLNPEEARASLEMPELVGADATMIRTDAAGSLGGLSGSSSRMARGPAQTAVHPLSQQVSLDDSSRSVAGLANTSLEGPPTKSIPLAAWAGGFGAVAAVVGAIIWSQSGSSEATEEAESFVAVQASAPQHEEVVIPDPPAPKPVAEKEKPAIKDEPEEEQSTPSVSAEPSPRPRPAVTRPRPRPSPQPTLRVVPIESPRPAVAPTPRPVAAPAPRPAPQPTAPAPRPSSGVDLGI